MRISDWSSDVCSSDLMKLLPVTDSGLAAMKKINAGYNKVIVPGGTYPKQDKDMPVIGYSTHFIVSCKLPADKVYAVTKMMETHIADMAAICRSEEHTSELQSIMRSSYAVFCLK